MSTLSTKPSLSRNQFISKVSYDTKLQESIRMMEYINMYNLKRDQILYQCPIFKSSPLDPEFEMEVQCIEEMGDIQIIYGKERKEQLTRIRREENSRMQKSSKEKNRNGIMGFLSTFLTPEKNKGSSTSPSKLKIDNNLIKSSAYIQKQTESQSKASGQNNSTTSPKIPNVSGIKPSIDPNSSGLSSLVFMLNSNVKNNNTAPKKQQQIHVSENGSGSKNIFSEKVDLTQQDLDELPDDSIDEKNKNKMIHSINEVPDEDESSIRSPNVSRDPTRKQDDKQNRNSQKRRTSKRIQHIDNQEQSYDMKPQNKPSKEEIDPVLEKSSKKSLQKLAKKGITDEQKSLIKTQKSKKQQPHQQNPLSKYISKQISRLSSVKSSSDEQQPSPQPIPENPKQDSFSDLKIDWIVKLQACQIQERLLLSRLKSRWIRPLQAINKIRNLQLHHFTPEVNVDPRLKWVKPNLNFGKVIQ